MLLSFSFSNFKSFKNRQTISFIASKIKDDINSGIPVQNCNQKVLTTVVFFGANASGKTSIFDAFEYMKYYVMESFSFSGEDSDPTYNIPSPFLFNSKSQSEPSTFEVIFTKDDAEDKMFKYGFSVSADGINEEYYYSKTKTGRKFVPVFSRKGNSVDLSGINEEYWNNIIVSLDKKTLIASLGAKLKVQECQSIRNWFSKNANVDFGDNFENLFRESILPKYFVKDDTVRRKVQSFISVFDDSIKDFNVEEIRYMDGNREKTRYRLKTVHFQNDTGEIIELDFKEESAGTKKMFSLYPSVLSVLKEGGVLFVDELNSKLHPLLVEEFVSIFKNPKTNPKHAQLVFSTHDIWTLENKRMRRDEICLVSKNERQESNVVRLSSKNIEQNNAAGKATAISKKYMSGKYGAIPQMKEFAVDCLSFDFLNNESQDNS